MNQEILHIAGAELMLVELVEKALQLGVKSRVHSSLDSLVGALETDPEAKGIFIGPPNPKQPNHTELDQFLRKTPPFQNRMMLIVDAPDIDFWSSPILGWEGKIYKHNGWDGLREATRNAALCLL